MVFRRRRFVRARPRRRVVRTRKAVARVVRQVMRRSVELKRITPIPLTTSFTTISSAWTEVNFADAITSNASDIGNRIGRKIAIRSFYLDGVLQGGQSNLSTDDRFNTVRFVVGLWRNTLPCASSGFDMSSMINQSGLSTTGGVNLIRKYRDFKVVLQSPGQDTTGYLPAVRKVRIYIKFRKPIVITFGSTNATTDQDKRLYLSVRSDSIAPPSPGFVNGSYTATWYDM